MIQKAMQYLIDQCQKETIEVDGETFMLGHYKRVTEAEVDVLTTHSLTSLVDYIREQPDDLKKYGMVVHVLRPSKVKIISTIFGAKQRECVLQAECIQDDFSFGHFIEVDQFITTVDVSWNEAWTGTEQVRFYKLDGERLDILTAWMPHPAHPERIGRAILSWERAK